MCIRDRFRALGYTPHPIAVDNYFKNREDYPRDENGKLDMEALECVDIEKFNEDMNGLLNGRLVEIPRFNFVTGTREMCIRDSSWTIRRWMSLRYRQMTTWIRTDVYKRQPSVWPRRSTLISCRRGMERLAGMWRAEYGKLP